MCTEGPLRYDYIRFRAHGAKSRHGKKMSLNGESVKAQVGEDGLGGASRLLTASGGPQAQVQQSAKGWFFITIPGNGEVPSLKTSSTVGS